jgi:hypothetical protein
VDEPEYTGPMPALTFQNGQLLDGGTKTITQIIWRTLQISTDVLGVNTMLINEHPVSIPD